MIMHLSVVRATVQKTFIYLFIKGKKNIAVRLEY